MVFDVEFSRAELQRRLRSAGSDRGAGRFAFDKALSFVDITANWLISGLP